MVEEKTMGRDLDNMYEWRKKNQKRFEFYLNKELDKDVYEWFETKTNKRQYLIDLIRKDLNEHQERADKEN